MHQKSWKILVREWFPIICGAFYLSGISGFIYETIFYYINNGGLTKRGTCFGPWIQIYGFGGVMILLLLYRFRGKPLLVFLMSGFSAGILEYVVGYCMYHFMDGRRTWDYNTEMWNWGNIDGFVCARSVLVFACAGMILIYLVVPGLKKLRDKMNPGLFLLLMYLPAAAFFADIVYNDLLAKVIPLKTAYDFYLETGWFFKVDN